MAVHPLRGIAKSQIKLVLRTSNTTFEQKWLEAKWLEPVESGIGLKGHEPVQGQFGLFMSGPKRHWFKAVLAQSGFAQSGHNLSASGVAVVGMESRRTRERDADCLTSRSKNQRPPMMSIRDMEAFPQILGDSVDFVMHTKCCAREQESLWPAASSEQGGPCTGSLGKGVPCQDVTKSPSG